MHFEEIPMMSTSFLQFCRGCRYTHYRIVDKWAMSLERRTYEDLLKKTHSILDLNKNRLRNLLQVFYILHLFLLKNIIIFSALYQIIDAYVLFINY